MIRTLAIIALAGFVLSIASFAVAVAVGGPAAITDLAWGNGWGPVRHGHFGPDDRDEFAADAGADATPTETRELAWTGSDRLEVEIPADVTYTQAPGPAKLVVTGPRRAIDDLVVEDGRISFEHSRRHRRNFGRALTITLTAPDVQRFDLDGSGRLEIRDYRQDKLDVSLAGSGDITARGQAREVNLDIAGSGRADLGQIVAETAEVNIAGSGEATVAPTKRARLDVSGSGDVTLLTPPADLQSEVSGSGTIRQGASASAAAQPAPPAAPAAPKAPKGKITP
jgi:hypothetical protein